MNVATSSNITVHIALFVVIFCDLILSSGHKFKAIQKHGSLVRIKISLDRCQSQPDLKENWAPGVTPALWGKLEDDDSDDEHSDDHHARKNKHKHEHEHAEVPTYHRPQYQNDEAPYQPQYQAAPQYQNAPQQQNTTPPQYHNDQGYVHQGTRRHFPSITILFDKCNLTEKPPQHSEEEKKGNWFSDHKTELEVRLGFTLLIFIWSRL